MTWRVGALCAIALAIAFVFYQMTLPDRDTYGLNFTVLRTGGAIHVTSVDRGSAAAKAGIVAGDTIAYGDTALERGRVLYATAGTPVTLTVNGSRRVTLVARRGPRLPLPVVSLFIRLAFLLVAALIAWRRPNDPAARALVAFLFCFGLAISLSNGVLPNVIASIIVFQLLNGSLYVVGTAAVATFAARFPSGIARPLPGLLARVATFIAVVTVAAAFTVEWLPRTAAGVSLLNDTFYIAFVVLGILVLATLVVAYVQGEPSERQRRRWVFLLLGIGLAGPLVDVIVQGTIGFREWVDNLSLLPLGVLPLGLAYVILRHRVIDVGFVLNRAVVYTIVSTVIVAVFVIVETLAGKYLEQTSHVASLTVQLGVTLLLGFSVRYIHSQVDRLVDTMLFRDRHLAEARIREFAHDASFITDETTLLVRCVQNVERWMHARGAGIWRYAGNGAYRPAQSTFPQSPEVDENDPAVVAMRARHVVVDLQDYGSRLPGILAFPMTVRGELIGILLCGLKAEDETYAPDERDALEAMAASVGHALDAIEVRELRRRLAQLEGLPA